MNVEGFISVKIKCKDFFYAQNDKNGEWNCECRDFISVK